MTQDRKAKLKVIQTKLKALAPEEKAALLAKGIVVTIEGRQLSHHNTIMIYMQADVDKLPTVVGGYRQWQKAGRQVRKGETGLAFWFPSGPKQHDGDQEVDAERFFVGTVFDITQTDPLAVAA